MIVQLSPEMYSMKYPPLSNISYSITSISDSLGIRLLSIFPVTSNTVAVLNFMTSPNVESFIVGVVWTDDGIPVMPIAFNC